MLNTALGQGLGGVMSVLAYEHGSRPAVETQWVGAFLRQCRETLEVAASGGDNASCIPGSVLAPSCCSGTVPGPSVPAGKSRGCPT